MVKKKRQRKLCLYPHRFFKVFLPDQSSHRMKFPPAFLKYFSGTIPFKSTIISPMKSSWQVDLLQIDDSLYFQKGWKQFVRENSLNFGDFLVFSYDGNAIFRVKIYGPNGCEKEPTCHVKENYRELSLPLENQIPEKRGHKRFDYASISKNFKEDDRDVKKASEFKSDFPFFKVVMQPSYVSGGSLNVPASFIKKHMIRNTFGNRRIALVYSDKFWPISVSAVRKFTGGWTSFSRDNALKEGDICVFELVDSNDYVLKVSIFRCLG